MIKIIIGCIILFLFFGGCPREKPRLDLEIPGSQGPFLISEEDPSEATQQITTFSLSGYGDEGKKRWEVQGESAQVLDKVVRLNKVVARAYGEEGEITLTADKGSFNKKEGEVHLEENVVVVTSEGTKLTTHTLNWNARKEVVETESPLVIERDQILTQGRGAVAYPQLNKVKIIEDVKVEVEPQTTITCRGPLDVNYEKNIAVFYGDVEVNDPRGKIFSDKMEVFFDPKTKKIEKIIASGNVKIMHERNIAYAEEAVYNVSLGKATLKGNPRLVIYPKE